MPPPTHSQLFFFFSLPYFANAFSNVFAMPVPPGADPKQPLQDLPLNSPGSAGRTLPPPSIPPQGINTRGGFSFRPRVRCLSNTPEWKREQKDSGKLQNIARTKTWVSFDKSVAAPRRKIYTNLYTNLSPVKTTSAKPKS